MALTGHGTSGCNSDDPAEPPAPGEQSACQRTCSHLVSECSGMADVGDECVERCGTEHSFAQQNACDDEFGSMLDCCARVSIGEDVTSECEDGGAEVFEECDQACETAGDDYKACINAASLGDAGSPGSGGLAGSSAGTGGAGSGAGAGNSGSGGMNQGGMNSGTSGTSGLSCNGVAYTRTDRLGTAICLDGAKSFQCGWASGDPTLDGLVTYGVFDAAMNKLTLNFYDYPTDQVPTAFVFETRFAPSSSIDLTLIYEGARSGDYDEVESWAKATERDVMGLCNGQGPASWCGEPGQFEITQAGSSAWEWDDHVTDNATGLVWNRGLVHAELGDYPTCTGLAEQDPSCCIYEDRKDADGYKVSCYLADAIELCATFQARLPTRDEIDQLQPHFYCAIQQYGGNGWTSTEGQSPTRQVYFDSMGNTDDELSKTLFPMDVLCVR
jgi:hypothetical protein